VNVDIHQMSSFTLTDIIIRHKMVCKYLLVTYNIGYNLVSSSHFLLSFFVTEIKFFFNIKQHLSWTVMRLPSSVVYMYTTYIRLTIRSDSARRYCSISSLTERDDNTSTFAGVGCRTPQNVTWFVLRRHGESRYI